MPLIVCIAVLCQDLPDDQLCLMAGGVTIYGNIGPLLGL